MNFKKKQIGILSFVTIGACLFIYIGSTMQRTTAELFASPDETAVMMFARAWEFGRGFRLPHGLPSELQHFAGLHPRSMVRQGDYLVPVGFLGMPLIVSLAEKAAKGLGAYVTLILVLSAAYPLWRLASGGSRPSYERNARVAAITVFIFLSFPTVLLYVNRGLFPNLPVVALSIWAVYATYNLSNFEYRISNIERRGLKRIFSTFDIRHSTFIFSIMTGLALGLALIIRPVESIWIIPWIAWAVWIGLRRMKHALIPPTKRRLPYITAVVVAFIICLFGGRLAMQTYPYHASIKDQPVIGYLLKDYADPTIREGEPAAIVSYTEAPKTDADWKRFFPFGFHPRVMWENVRTFLFGYVGLWIGAALFGAFFALRKRWDRDSLVFLSLSGWTLASLLIFYGQSLYTDNIRGTVSLGNSFLRYMLPLVPIIAYGCALFINAIWLRSLRGKILGIGGVIFFILFGIGIAFAHDEEGIIRTRYELQRYALIREQAERAVEEPAIVLSERSDKIFASGPFVAVSPLPSDEYLTEISASASNVYMFHRTLDGGPTEDRIRSSFGIPFGLFTLNNETFYELLAVPQEADLRKL